MRRAKIRSLTLAAYWLTCYCPTVMTDDAMTVVTSLVDFQRKYFAEPK